MIQLQIYPSIPGCIPKVLSLFSLSYFNKDLRGNPSSGYSGLYLSKVML